MAEFTDVPSAAAVGVAGFADAQRHTGVMVHNDWGPAELPGKRILIMSSLDEYPVHVVVKHFEVLCKAQSSWATTPSTKWWLESLGLCAPEVSVPGVSEIGERTIRDMRAWFRNLHTNAGLGDDDDMLALDRLRDRARKTNADELVAALTRKPRERPRRRHHQRILKQPTG